MNKAQFMKAARSGNHHLIEKYIKDGFDISTDGNLALREATFHGHFDVIKTLIENGADVNIEYINGDTALMRAVMVGRNEIVKTLIDYGADINAKDNDGWTALIYASYREYNDIVKTLLIDYQAKVSEIDKGMLKEIGATFTLDLIAKIEFEKQLQQEVKPIPEIPIKKKSLSMKI